MPKVKGVWGKILNVLYNLLKWGKDADLFDKDGKPLPPRRMPKGPLVVLALLMVGCASLEAKLDNCIELMQTCEVSTSHGECICKPSPSPTPEASPSATPSPTPEPSAQPTPEPTPTPAPVPACTLSPMPECGPGCCRHVEGADGVYQDDVAFALDVVVATNKYTSNGKVTDQAGYLAAVAATLRSMGYCSEVSGAFDEVAVKKTNDFNEQYDLIQGDGSVTMFLASTCTPARH